MANYIKIENEGNVYYLKVSEIKTISLIDDRSIRIGFKTDINSNWTFRYNTKEEAEQVIQTIIEAENGTVVICEKDIKKATLENLVKAISKITNNGEIDDKSLDRFDNLLNDK